MHELAHSPDPREEAASDDHPASAPRAGRAKPAPRAPRACVETPRSRLPSVSSIVCRAARIVWPAVEKLHTLLPSKPRTAHWAPGPAERSFERKRPPLGWPRETDSLCPRCVKEVRAEILSGRRPLADLVLGRPAEVKATIREEGGRIVMDKSCPRHGRIVDLLSIDPAFHRRIERLFPGYDYRGVPTHLRRHGSSSVQWGRGAVLTIDLTNRCNMMCEPCFMDANQVGYVHELGMDDVRKILDDSLRVIPRRQMSVQFSGGEPTLSPIFLDSIRYARENGYFAVQAATNGVRFAQDPDFAFEARDAGLRMAYLQFDGIGNAAHAHRKVANLYDVKLRAIEHLAAAKIDVVLVPTIVNGVNDDQVGSIVDFAIENSDKVSVVSFQPVAFTGRDEDVDDDTRARQRYTLSHLVHDIKLQTGYAEPLRDWFPLSALGPFSDLVDAISHTTSPWGSMKCGCHPNCGVGTILFVNKRTKQVIPLSELLDLDQLLLDLTAIADAGHPRTAMLAQTGVALARSFRPDKAPAGYGLPQLVDQFLSQTGASGIGKTTGDSDRYPWRVLFVAGMWFQDVFNYDFRRTEACIIPYGTQEGEISFCAYNTGIGWRQFVEQRHMTATTARWYREHGRTPVYAKGQAIPLAKGGGKGAGEAAPAEKKPRVRLHVVP
ncbi:MAG: radical SAM protein [Deltaproteobacteria bacterium]|nr:radical SAM protein [Deltaproteobacteria bacterium]